MQKEAANSHSRLCAEAGSDLNKKFDESQYDHFKHLSTSFVQFNYPYPRVHNTTLLSMIPVNINI